MKPEVFKQAWDEVAARHDYKQAIVANWAWNRHELRPRNSRGLPARGHLTQDDLTRLSQHVLEEVAVELGLGITWECPLDVNDGRSTGIDAVLFQEADDGTRRPIVAWEHENVIQNIDDELAHLVSYAPPLMVLVTYPNPRHASQDYDNSLT